MRIFNIQAVARLTFPDRNPTMSTIGYNAGAIAPAILTTRATYTVPANRKASLDSSYAMVTRDAVATTAGAQSARVQYTKSGGAALDVAWARNFAGNTIGVQDRDRAGNLGFMLAGDAISVATQDNSTGGTGDYEMAVKINEADA